MRNKKTGENLPKGAWTIHRAYNQGEGKGVLTTDLFDEEQLQLQERI